MKILRLVLATLAIGVASISTAQAHDSFSFGLNIGTPYYAPYIPPAVTYYPNPPVYYAPQASFGYWNGGHHGWGGRGRHEHEEHEEHEHGWHDD